MSNKKVSIITASYNCVSKNQKTFFYEMFKSVHGQDYQNIEHVIVDGGSKDGSVEFIKDIINKYGKKEIVFFSEQDRGINDATNKGYLKSSGDYITVMCDDDFYIRPDAVSLLVKTLEKNNADFSCSDSWWLDSECWDNDVKSFIYRHPFLINALLLKRELIKDFPYYLDVNYPMVADYDLFLRLLINDKIKGSTTKEVLTVLRSGGVSQSSYIKYNKEVMAIYRKYFPSVIISQKELIKMHYGHLKLITIVKMLLLCKNKKIKSSIKYFAKKKYTKEYFIKKFKYILFLEFIKNMWFFIDKNRVKKKKNDFSRADSRKWIETFYDGLF